MRVPIQCSFCGQTFQFDCSLGKLVANCSHCKNQNTISISSSTPKELQIQRDAPNLSGAKTCPSCKATLGRDAVLCIRCGHDFKTGKKIVKPSWFAENKVAVFSSSASLVVAILVMAFIFWPKTPPPPIAPITPPLATQPPATPPPKPAPPPASTPAQLAAKQAETDRALFETKKRQAEQTLRRQLDANKPMYKLGSAVELRRKNGVMDKGTLQEFTGTSSNRIAIVVTPTQKTAVPIVSLDPDSRIRIDSDYREAFIRHLLNNPKPTEKPKS